MEAQIGKRGQLSFSFRFFPLLSVSFRSFPFLSVLLFLTVLASCRERPTAQTSFDPETYVVLTKGGYDSLDPAWAYDVPTSTIILNIYETLFSYHKSSIKKLDPMLATEVPSRKNGLISKDGRVYTIPLRRGVYFQDGTPMAPEDVRYSLLRFMLSDRDGGPSVLLLQPLLGVPSTRDDSGKIIPRIGKRAFKAVQIRGNNLILTLPRPYAPLLSILATWAPIVSEKWAASRGAWDGSLKTWKKFNNPKKLDSPFFEKTNGTGAFSLGRWDRKTHEIVLNRNEHYWRKPARIKHIVIRSINEFETQKLLFESGAADSISISRQHLPQIQNIPGIKIADVPVLGTNPSAFFTFHISTQANSFIGSGKLDGQGIPPDFFSHKNIRKAFAYSFDYQGYIRDIEGGKGFQPNGCIPNGMLGHNPNQKTYHLDLKKAKSYFKKALGGKVWQKGFRFTMEYNAGSGASMAIAHIFQHNVESLNSRFHINLRPMDWSTFLDALNSSRIPLFPIGWTADYPDPDDFAFPLMDSRGVYPFTQGYRNPKADKIIEQAAHELNLKKRERLYWELQEIEYEDVPHILIVEPFELHVRRSWVHGWVYNPVRSAYFYPLYKELPKTGKTNHD